MYKLTRTRPFYDYNLCNAKVSSYPISCGSTLLVSISCGSTLLVSISCGSTLLVSISF
jgi:hypothetical protein